MSCPTQEYRPRERWSGESNGDNAFLGFLKGDGLQRNRWYWRFVMVAADGLGRGLWG